MSVNIFGGWEVLGEVSRDWGEGSMRFVDGVRMSVGKECVRGVGRVKNDRRGMKG